jgi:hypothetical protein
MAWSWLGPGNGESTELLVEPTGDGATVGPPNGARGAADGSANMNKRGARTRCGSR